MSVLTPFRLDVSTFDSLCVAGAFGDRKVELLNGLLIMRTTGPAHDLTVTAVSDALKARLDKAKWTVREEKPVVLSTRWKPVPDVAVVRGHFRDYALRTPHAGDVALLVEVSDSTYAKDSQFKRRWYGRLGVRSYWVVDLSRRMIEVYEARGETLELVATYPADGEARVSLDGRDFGGVAVAELLP